MLDRQVLQIQSELGLDERIRPFSSHWATANLVVLGDPGAGKTELFRQSAKATGGHFLTVRNFLNTPAEALPRDKSLWIDGLDETRSGRGDRGTIDRLVQKLHAVRPPALRLSCRVADWLGTSDLSALASYFDLYGGAPVVVQLQPLGRDEQRQILSAHGRADPEGFLDDAQHRGLDGMLSNPQTLLMLHLAVQDAAWPTTRESLFEKATTLLLREHNAEHRERTDAANQQTLVSVSDAAGALCALRLVSDCAGFSLHAEGTDEMPGWGEIPLAEPAAIQVALSRRVFVAAGEPDAVDYLHRTIAEYLGAGWIAGKIAAGLPLGRVQALLGVDGQPASSLRGLHAWLAVRSPESAPVLIDADPMGIVMYADAARLPPSDKRRLLSALGRTAERDPWFYQGIYAAYGVGALSDPAMAETFRDLLRAADTPFALRKLIVDAVAMGSPMPTLREDLHALLIDPQQPFALRDGALDALLAMDDEGRRAVVSAYSGLSNDDSGLRLRCIALRALYGQGLEGNHLVELVAAILSPQPEFSIGMTFGLTQRVPAAEAPELLDQLDFTGVMPEHGYSFRKTRDLVRVYEGLLVKALTIQPRPVPQQIYAWLRNLLRYTRQDRLDGELVRTLLLDRHASDAVLDAWISHCDTKIPWPDQWDSFQRSFKDCFSTEKIVDAVLRKLDCISPERKLFHYRHVLSACMSDPDQWRDVFWRAYDHAEKDDDLLSVRKEHCQCQVRTWQNDRRIAEKKRREREARQKEKILRKFDECKEEISSGRHVGWLVEMADYYFEYFDDLGQDPMSRMENFFGKERLEIAVSGFRLFAKEAKPPSLNEVIKSHVKRKIVPQWMALLAGFEMRSDSDLENHQVDDEKLRSVIAIKCLYSKFRHGSNSESEWSHPWLRDAVRRKPELVRATYVAIIEAGLAVDERYPDGIDELRNVSLSGPDRGAHIQRILRNFPGMHHDALEKLLRLARVDDLWPSLRDATAAGVSFNHPDSRQGTRCLWLAFGFLTEPERYGPKIESLQRDEAKEMVWPLLKVGSLDFHRDIDFGTYDANQLEYVAVHAAKFYPYALAPTGIIRWRENSWDVSRAIDNALSSLAASTDDTAHAALRRLLVHPALESYASQVRHLLAQQCTRRIDAAHVPLDWQAAARTLMNREPASAQDLHALVQHHMEAVCQQIAHDNADAYRQFWNEGAHGKVSSPRSENGARDVLLGLLRPRLQPLGLRAEPEGDMARDKRADIVVFGRDIKCPIELKRQHHPEVWTAAEYQLDRLYARDPQASGHGIYGVFWYGEGRDKPIPLPPAGVPRPRSADAMQRSLRLLLPEHLQAKIAIVVIDVSGQPPPNGPERDE